MQNYQAPKDLLNGRNIVITGAGDGIGREAALTYAAHGATVILMGKTLQKLEKVYDEIEAAGYPQPAIININFETANPNHYKTVFETLAEEFGTLHGLLINAGILGQRTSIANYSPGIWQQVMQVNINSAFLLIQSLLPLLQHDDDAAIITTSSSVGRKGRAFWSAYGVSKFALEGLTETLADELDGTSKVRINSLNPGATKTTMRAAAYPGEDPNELKSAKDIMPLYLYLMGKDSIGISGEKFDCQIK